jgi:OmpA-OmpF porin, OOP family
MKTFLSLLTLAWLIGSTYWYANSSCSSCNANKQLSENLNPLKKHPFKFSLSDGDWSKSFDHLKFKKNGFDPILGGTSEAGLLALVERGKLKNPSRMIELIGFYNSDEKNSTKFENLGIARAEKIKEWLVSKGLEKGNIFTAGHAISDSDPHYLANDTIWGGLDVKINQLKAGQKTELSEEALLEPRTVYFETGKNAIVITEEFSNYLLNAKDYLAKNKNVKLNIVGHTDNQGNPTTNLTLSKERAAFVLTELSKKGLNQNQMLSDGKGITQPIEDNNTAEGRAKNRRVEIQIMK